MSMISEGAMAVAMIAAGVLAVFGVRMAVNGGDRKRGLLMVAAAVVLVGNVIVLTI